MLYFNIWDRLMGTNAHDYEALLEEIDARAKRARAERKVRDTAAEVGFLQGASAVRLQ